MKTYVFTARCNDRKILLYAHEFLRMEFPSVVFGEITEHEVQE
jgi:hypothetical protein